MMNKTNKTNRMNKNKKKKTPKWYLYIPFWIFIVGMFSSLIIMQMSRYGEYRQELDRLRAELAHEQQMAVDLRHRQAFYESDAYIERLAREMLGFVRQDEIVFQNIAE